MKKFFAEFKKFIQRGNVVDLAVGVIIGGAFSKITSSLVNDIIMPLITAVLNLLGLQGGTKGMFLLHPLMHYPELHETSLRCMLFRLLR